MKKFAALLIALTMCLALTACGGPDRQPAIDAFNQAKDAFNEVAEAINQNPDAYDPELVQIMVDMSGLLEEHGALLSGEDELTEEQLDEMIAWYAEVEQWVAEAKAELGIQ